MATKSIDPAATATTTMNIKFENQDETLTLAAPDAPTPESRTTSDSTVPSQAKPHPTTGGDEGASNGAESKPKEAEFATKSVTSLSANDVEKKVRRAERFGVPLHLSEKEKRNSRAERFGTVPGSDVAKSSEELKRKARAERFGLPENSAADEDGTKKARHSSADEEGKKKARHSSADEEGKKKARLARFGSDVKLDSQEEEKRKARALRFAGSPLSNTNGKGNDQVKAAVTGSTVGGT